MNVGNVERDRKAVGLGNAKSSFDRLESRSEIFLNRVGLDALQPCSMGEGKLWITAHCREDMQRTVPSGLAPLRQAGSHNSALRVRRVILMLDRVLLLAVGELCRAACRFRFC